MLRPVALTTATRVQAYRDASATNAVKIDAPDNAKAWCSMCEE